MSLENVERREKQLRAHLREVAAVSWKSSGGVLAEAGELGGPANPLPRGGVRDGERFQDRQSPRPRCGSLKRLPH